MVLDKIEGRWATAWRIPRPENHNVTDWNGTVDHWLIHSEHAHPAWHYFWLSCVHLRPIEGQSRPPVLQFPDSTHEILLVALNPKYEPWDPDTAMERLSAMWDNNQSPMLTPINVIKQLRDATDEQATKMLELIAKSLTIGHLPLEPDGILGAREWWEQVIDRTMEHIRLGTHPSEN